MTGSLPDTATADPDLGGKPVVASNGEPFGVVASVSNQTMYVALDHDISDRLQARLGWDGGDGEAYPIGTTAIDRVTDDAVYLTAL